MIRAAKAIADIDIAASIFVNGIISRYTKNIVLHDTYTAVEAATRPAVDDRLFTVLGHLLGSD